MVSNNLGSDLYQTYLAQMLKIRLEVSAFRQWQVRFDTYQRIVEGNPEIQTPSMFHQWLYMLFVLWLSVGIRRQTDKRTGKEVSLRNLLGKISKNRAAITEEIPTEHRVLLEQVEGDAEALDKDESVQIVRKFVGGIAVHADKKRARMPKDFSDLEAAAALLETLTNKYLALFPSIPQIAVIPEEHDLWWHIFKKPWIRSDDSPP